MKFILVFAIAFIALSLGSGSVSAQDPAPTVINGGILNGKAVSLPKPEYPAEAKEARAEGAVAVVVVIDEAGAVISAEAQPSAQSVKRSENGTWTDIKEVHPALRAAAEHAAMKARFSPTLLSGQPVQVNGIIVYNFVADGGAANGKNISGGVLNNKAASLPNPEYPPAALAVHAQGSVTVQVEIDENGDVASAAAVSGHPLLRRAAVAAAREAKFAPTKLNGEPVKVSGVVTYNFVAP